MSKEYYWMVIDDGVACGMRTRAYELCRAAAAGRGVSVMVESSCAERPTVKAQPGEFRVSGPVRKQRQRDLDRHCTEARAGV
jgi:hypothetical protein